MIFCSSLQSAAVVADYDIRCIVNVIHKKLHYHDEMLEAVHNHNMQIYDEILSSVSFLEDSRDFPSAVDFPPYMIGSDRTRRPLSSSDDDSDI